MGLNDNEVTIQREKFGNNALTKYKKNSFFKLLMESLGDPIIKILLLALAIKIIFLFKNYDWFETIGIIIAILLASFISSLSEYGSEAAFEKLQAESSKIFVKVFRNKKETQIPINEIVVKDIIILSSGDKVPADGILIKGDISVDESMLNGETKEIKKSFTSEYNNKVFRGSVVYSGYGLVEITATGDNTIYGNISKELQSNNPDSPLKIRLRDLAKVISKIGYIGAILTSISYLFMEIVVNNYFNPTLIMQTLSNFREMADYLIYALTLSVTIIVVAVPEGLPMMITLVLSSNMKKMLKDNVLVRKLVGIETAGSMNILCVDKTGTLTKGKLELIEIIDGDGNRINELTKIKDQCYFFYKTLLYAIKYNNESILSNELIIGGNSTDKALMEFVKKYEIKKPIIKERTLFNSENKYSSIKIEETKYFKGAPEILIPRCNKYLTKSGVIKKLITKRYINKYMENMTKKGSRVICITMEKDNDNTFIGLLKIKDDLRSETKNGINLIKNAGINIIMITGDSKETAISIGNEIGLLDNPKNIVLDSKEFNQKTDEEIQKTLPYLKILSRSLPQDKSRLVSIIENMNLIVGMTGDGVNDAPALKKANVGFAMGSGTEVAKEASDIVILDDNILSIGKSVLYGRTIFKSIRKFIIYQLSVNTCALIISIVGTLIGIQNPITIIQMLWLNMIMDTFAGLAFSFEPPLIEYMNEDPKKIDEKIINKYMYSEIITSGLYSSILCLLFLKLPFFKNIIRFDFNNKYLMTAYFAMFIFIGICNAFNSRTIRINIFANILKNKVFLIVFSFITIVQIYIIYFGGNLFRTYGLNIKELIIIIVLALTTFPIDFLRKWLIKRRKLKIGV